MIHSVDAITVVVVVVIVDVVVVMIVAVVVAVVVIIAAVVIVAVVVVVIVAVVVVLIVAVVVVAVIVDVVVAIFIVAVVVIIIIYVYLSKCSSFNLNSQVLQSSSAFAKSLQSEARRFPNSSMKLHVLVILSTLVALNYGVQLSAKPDGLYYNGKKVFLSGVNIAWNWYGYDFGNNKVM